MSNESELMTLTLYGTSACHLCELAEMLLQDLGEDLRYVKMDISESDDLFERYGLLIPVLQHPDGRELGWPFTAEQVSGFIGVTSG